MAIYPTVGQDLQGSAAAGMTYLISTVYDPTLQPLSAVKGTLALGVGDSSVGGRAWLKQDNGPSTNWTEIPLSGGTGFSAGDGSDGDVIVNAPITLTRNMFYNNLTIVAGGSIQTDGYIIFVRGILDLSNAPASAIKNPGVNGNNAVANTAGAGISAPAGIMHGGGSGGTGGGNGGSGVGIQGGAVSTINGNGGPGGGGGAGGNAASAGAAASPGGIVNPFPFRTTSPVFLRGTGLISSGQGGRGGSSGGGDGTANSGGGGGGGGSGAGAILLFAGTILRGPGTAPGAINARGGSGGNGGTHAAGNRSGGGGAGGGGGGYVHIVCPVYAGAPAPGAVEISGGNGGSGGNGIGSGTGGDGGYGGNAGTLMQLDPSTGATTVQGGAAGAPGAAAIGNTGGAGGAGGMGVFNL